MRAREEVLDVEEERLGSWRWVLMNSAGYWWEVFG